MTLAGQMPPSVGWNEGEWRDLLGRRDWPALGEELDRQGYGQIPKLLTSTQCHEIAAMYESEPLFRSRIRMARHGFGQGEYKYFAYPLPTEVAGLRTALYERLAPVANRWSESLQWNVDYPGKHQTFLARCHAAEQLRPTPLLLSYREGDYNCLHQDLYGEHAFPLQVAVLLSQPDEDFTGGEFVLTEQRPRMQSKASVVPLARGDAVVFAVNHRPVRGARGNYRVTLRHGVSRVRSGNRRVLGVIFHDAT